MGTPLYNTDIIPLTSRPTLTVIDDGDYFVILDTSTGKISKILKTNIMTALKISYDNTTSGLTAENVQAALDELVVNLGSSDSAILALSGRLDTLEGTGEGSVAKAIDAAIADLAGAGRTAETVKGNADAIKQTNSHVALLSSDVETIKKNQNLNSNDVELTEEDIGIVPLPANAIGRALVEMDGLTVTNLVENGDGADGTNHWSAYTGTLRSIDGTSLVGTGLGTQSVIQLRTDNSHILGNKYYIKIRVRVVGTGCTSLVMNRPDTTTIIQASPVDGTWYVYNGVVTADMANGIWVTAVFPDNATQNGKKLEIDFSYGVTDINITATFGSTLASAYTTVMGAKQFPSYFSGTQSIKMPMKVVSENADESESTSLYLTDAGDVQSIQDVLDTVAVINGEMYTIKKVSTSQAVLSGVAVNTENYPLAKNGGKWANELTAGGTEIGVIGTGSTTGDGTLRYELATPITTKLTTIGNLLAFPNGRVYLEPNIIEAGIYNSGYSIANEDYPIDSIVKVTKIGSTGAETDITDSVIDGDSLGFTSASLTDGDVVVLEYAYESNGVQPDMSVSFLNNSLVVEDESVAGNFYRISFVVDNGVLTPTATLIS